MSQVKHSSSSSTSSSDGKSYMEQLPCNSSPKNNFPMNPNTRTVTLSDITQIQKNIQSLQQKNKQKFQKLNNQDHSFCYDLYTPPLLQNVRKIGIHATQQLLLKQLDKLFEEDSVLEKHLRKVNVQIQNQRDQRQNVCLKFNDDFMFMTIPFKQNKKMLSHANAEQKLQSLNLKVAMIKNNIQRRIQSEKYSLQNDLQTQIQQSIIKQSTAYQKLQKSYLEIKSKFELLTSQFHPRTTDIQIPQGKKYCSKNQLYSQEIQRQNLRMKQLTKQLKLKIKQKQKKQLELQKKINELLISNINNSKQKELTQSIYIQIRQVMQQSSESQTLDQEQLRENKMIFQVKYKDCQLQKLTDQGKSTLIPSSRTLAELINFIEGQEQINLQSMADLGLQQAFGSVNQTMRFLSTQRKRPTIIDMRQNSIKKDQTHRTKFNRNKSPKRVNANKKS